MTNTSTVEILISLDSPDLSGSELQEQAENLLPQIREVDGVEAANLVTEELSQRGAKGDGFIVGTIKAVIIPGSMSLFKFLKERLSGKPLEMNLKRIDGQELKIKAGSKEDIEFLSKKAEEFFKS
ncbi:sugar ABC transporter permease [Aetokthonos hydrillicola Thurmond2011]|jgi:hypothetical protein|uniref:Sugar ABC transporter permease n=2 Tax=Aetokthonos TaxID=1550243 RepID=A0AAP5I777_9CYAN|nr:sugar ABC transporter permease [Aetokthonos hydrillicola]MBO3457450.1 sugar ABC transporter permease [Aetokthonos hydrillicola CCALA 1050]MBW4586029.1 sugar ABC transporter permease [Aetokthonos hydrillicola CCALA 1050]MDR9893745.1 sugar ABC transporter permease [Aetokthonos hydrillicola Thurmond2011]